MSSYQKQTVHPETGIAERAEWLDDYFGHYNYGVRFPSDGKVFRADEFDWSERPEDLASEGFQRADRLTIDQTEKGSRWDNPMHEVSEENGKHVDVTKHEDGRQDVKVTVKRLDLKNPTPEDLAAEKVILDKLANTKVGVLVIHRYTNDNLYFTCSLPHIRTNAEIAIEKYREAHPETECKPEDFILVESAVVTEKPKVSTL